LYYVKYSIHVGYAQSIAWMGVSYHKM